MVVIGYGYKFFCHLFILLLVINYKLSLIQYYFEIALIE